MRASRPQAVFILLVAAPLADPRTAPASPQLPATWIQQAQDRNDWQLLFAADLLKKLSLSPAQGRELLAVHHKACALEVAFYQDQRAALRLALEAYPPYRDEKKLDRGITPEVEERAVAAHSRIKDIQLARDADLAALERQVLDEVLTSAQRRIAENYKPDRERLIEESGNAGRHAAGARSHAMTARRAAAANVAPREAALKNRLQGLEEELDKVEEFAHPRPGTLGRLLLTPTVSELLYTAAGQRLPPTVAEAQRVLRQGARDYPRTSFDRDARRVQALKNEINDWNLLNTLRLTAPQISAVLQAGLQAQRLRAYQQANRSPQAWLDGELHKLEAGVRGVLQPGQRKALDQFSTCFKGKPSLRDPVRVGQAGDETAMEDWLERSRTLDDDTLRRALEHRVDSEEKRLSGPLSPQQRDGRIAALMSAVRRAQAMDDVDFALNRGELAKTATIDSKAFELGRQIDRVHAELGEPGKIARLMFNEGLLRALLQRQQQLLSPETARQTPVVEIPKAENCDRTCALPAK